MSWSSQRFTRRSDLNCSSRQRGDGSSPDVLIRDRLGIGLFHQKRVCPCRFLNLIGHLCNQDTYKHVQQHELDSLQAYGNGHKACEWACSQEFQSSNWSSNRCRGAATMGGDITETPQLCPPHLPVTTSPWQVWVCAPPNKRQHPMQSHPSKPVHPQMFTTC